MSTEEIVVPAQPHKRIDTYVQTEGRCITCGTKMAIVFRYYLNLVTGEEHSIRVRESCSCTKEYDPYAKYVKPLQQWSNPGSPNGHWLEPVWIEGKGWELQ